MKQNQIAEISISYTPSRYNQAKILSKQDAYDILKKFFFAMADKEEINEEIAGQIIVLPFEDTHTWLYRLI